MCTATWRGLRWAHSRNACSLELYDGFSFLKAGLVFSDALTTVSPTYAREIRSPEFGEGVDGVIRSRAHVLQGITNGIDVEAWDPATDPFLVQRYDLESLAEGKRANKRAVQEAPGRQSSAGRPRASYSFRPKRPW